MSEGPGDAWLLHGGRVRSPEDPRATALLVQGGSVAWAGSADAVGGGAARRTALDGAWVTPAFVDAHVHLTATGLQASGPDLAGAPSLAATLDRVSDAARRSRGRVLLGSGWDESAWPERRPPTRRELDRAAWGGVVYLARADAHAAVVSSALLAGAPGAVSLPGGPSSPDDAVVTADAHAALRAAAWASVSPGQRRDAARAARSGAAALGVGVLHEMGAPQVSSADDLEDVLRLAADEPGPSVVGHWGGDVATAARLGVAAAGDVAVDGSLGARTACLRAPYADATATSGRRYLDADAVAEHAVAAVAAGLQPGFHAIGDAALDAVLDGLDAARRRLPPGALAAARPRLEHVEMGDARQVARLAEHGCVASVQPAFDAVWGGPDGLYAARLGPTRAAATNPWAALAAAGVPLALGSDSPVTPVAPWEGVRAAVHPHHGEHALSPRAAFSAATRGGWRAARREAGGGGDLSPGAPATFAVWEAGPLGVAVPDSRVRAWSTDPRAAVPGLPDLRPGTPLPRCLALVVDGRVVSGSVPGAPPS